MAIEIDLSDFTSAQFECSKSIRKRYRCSENYSLYSKLSIHSKSPKIGVTMSGQFQTFTCSVNTVASVGCMLQNSRSVNGVNTVSKITIEDCGLTSFKNVANDPLATMQA